MHKVIACIAAALAFASLSPAAFAQAVPAEPQIRSNSGGRGPGETSDRTPTKHSATPSSQIDTTADGETSDRTPANHGEVPPNERNASSLTN